MLPLSSNGPNDTLGPGVVITTGDVIVSSDHRLCKISGGDEADIDIDAFDLVLDVEPVEPLDMMRMGIRQVPEKDVKLSFLLRTELDMLSLRGQEDASGC